MDASKSSGFLTVVDALFCCCHKRKAKNMIINTRMNITIMRATVIERNE